MPVPDALRGQLDRGDSPASAPPLGGGAVPQRWAGTCTAAHGQACGASLGLLRSTSRSTPAVVHVGQHAQACQLCPRSTHPGGCALLSPLRAGALACPPGPQRARPGGGGGGGHGQGVDLRPAGPAPGAVARCWPGPCPASSSALRPAAPAWQSPTRRPWAVLPAGPPSGRGDVQPETRAELLPRP